MSNEEKIEYLSSDIAFGILTRPAFELAILESGQSWHLIVIDINNMHSLNRKHGYNAVNEKIKSILKNIARKHPTGVIGRLFSGDELAFAVKHGEEAYPLISDLKIEFGSEKIGFKYIEAEVSDLFITNISLLLTEYSYQLHKKPNFYKI